MKKILIFGFKALGTVILLSLVYSLFRGWKGPQRNIGDFPVIRENGHEY